MSLQIHPQGPSHKSYVPQADEPVAYTTPHQTPHDILSSLTFYIHQCIECSVPLQYT